MDLTAFFEVCYLCNEGSDQFFSIIKVVGNQKLWINFSQ
jgi:hypothetical protein